MKILTTLGTLACASAVIVLSLTPGAGSTNTPSRYFIRADLLFTGTALVKGQVAVAVEDGKVVAAGRLRIPSGARVLRFQNATILPGLIDLHVHDSPQLLLRDGVTTTRNLGEPVARLRPPYAADGYPRIVAAGPIITVPGGYPTGRLPELAAPVASASEAVATVDMLAAKGAALIKIGLETGRDGSLPTLSSEEVRAIVSEAHRLNRLVTAHVLEGKGLAIALAGGVDEIAHMPCLGVTPAQIAELAKRRIPVVGTLHVERLSGRCPDGVANARAFIRQGGTLLYGTDLPNVPPRLDLTELSLMRQAGMTPTQVLIGSTKLAGQQLGIAKLGTLAVGAPADILVVKGDPTRVLSALAHPLLVIARGKAVN
ncbi:amidohydrolase family protein [Gaiella occulta]|uniref:amidohydrolase family protein n=1 Tax=Gaiella occulta TaxID=1002870 RepID=UPI0015F09135|nr:amidohydrolase family protein [Gaiella occulta]